MKKKINTTISILLLFSGIAWLVLNGTETKVLQNGNKLPSINFITTIGNVKLESDKANKTLVIYFSKDCSHCKYELELLNKNIDMITTTKIYLFTTDIEYLQSAEIKVNAALLKSTNVTYGIVNKEEFINNFGSTVTPSLFFFNKSGKLTAKIMGETKWERILKELRVSDGAQHRDSGTNKLSFAVGHN